MTKNSTVTCEFDVTIISVSNPTETTAWLSTEGIYVTISIAGQVYETCVVEMGKPLEWNNAFTFTAQEGQNMILSLYAISKSSVRDDDVLLGQLTECLRGNEFDDTTRVMTRTRSKEPFSISFRIRKPGSTSRTRSEPGRLFIFWK